MKVFLGGTCNESTWRDRLISQLKDVDYFNPVVPDWTEECMAEEINQRESCDFVLYVITPFMTGVYAIAEAVDDSNKRPGKTLFCFLGCDLNESGESKSFTIGQMMSLAVKFKYKRCSFSKPNINSPHQYNCLNTNRLDSIHKIRSLHFSLSFFELAP